MKLEWPADLRPQSAEWTLFQAPITARSLFSQTIEQKLVGPARWSFTVGVPPLVSSHRVKKSESRQAWEAFVRRLRGGLNTVEAWDMRSSSILGFEPSEAGKYRNMLLMSGHWQHWGRILSVGAVSGNVLTVGETNDYWDMPGVPFRAGINYTFACDIRSTNGAQVALSFGEDSFGTAGAVFDGGGTALSTFGGASAGGYSLAGGYTRVWINAKARANGFDPVHLYVLTNGSGETMALRRPQVSDWPATVNYTESFATVAEDDGVPVPYVYGSAQTGDTLVTRGWRPLSELKEGHYFAVNGELKFLLETTTADSNGQASLWFEPPLRRSPADGTSLEIRRPKAEFRLVTPQAGFSQTGLYTDAVDLQFEEVIRLTAQVSASNYADNYADNYA